MFDKIDNLGECVWSFSRKQWGVIVEIEYDSYLKVKFGDIFIKYTTDGKIKEEHKNSDLFWQNFEIPSNAFKKQKWRAYENEDFYYVNGILEVIKKKETCGEIDSIMYEIGNYFKTEEKAKKYASKIKKVLEGIE